MKILHISDTHGIPPEPRGDFDVVVHSGDLMPNRSFGVKEIEYTFQRYWIEANASKFPARLKEKLFLFCPGNHDFIDPTPYMRDVGINAQLIHENYLDVEDVRFYGFPWTPTFYDWNWMCGPEEMAARLSPVVELMEQGGIDVFISHGPMFGVLDRNRDGERCGCKVLRKTMQDVRHPPKLHLHGHIHESAGFVGWSRGLRVSNAACTQRIIEL